MTPRCCNGVAALAAVALLSVLTVEGRVRLDQAPSAGPTSAALALPAGEGKALVERACGGCHDPSLVMFTREDEEGWAVIVNDMAARGAKATPDELQAITRYLAEKFPRGSGVSSLVPEGVGTAADAPDNATRIAAGREIYQFLCTGCHGADGRGKDRIAPPLVASGLVLAPAGIPVRIMLHGKRGATNVMPGLGRFMTDAQIAATLSYVRGEWGHTAEPLDAATVREIRSVTAGRARPWTVEELRQAVPGGG
jgi:mono/diheme cytochrome c family protein